MKILDKRQKNLLRTGLALVLMIVSIPVFSMGAFANAESGDAPQTRSVQYYDPTDNQDKRHDCREVEQNMGENSPGWYVVSKNTTFEEPVNIKGNVNLILCNGVTLTAQKGIRVESQCAITIWAQVRAGSERGTIVATGADGAAGIGGAANMVAAGSSITINGGFIRATGGSGAAGIGGGQGGSSGFRSIEIRTATVYANGTGGGAGLGAGYGNESYLLESPNGAILIRRSMVFATGGAFSDGGADAGSGIRCRTLTIDNAKDDRAEFTGKGKGSGIDARETTIYNGVVTATGSGGGAGMRCEAGSNVVNIFDGTVRAEGNGGGAGIGGCNEAEMAGYVSLDDGTVTSIGSGGAAGIGGGNKADMSGEVHITGGTVTVHGNDGGAGIGGGAEGDFTGRIKISGGTVKTWGGTYYDYDKAPRDFGYANGGAGIGSGREGNARDGHIHITGGTVRAYGGVLGAGIGGGRESPNLYIGGEGCDDVQISGSAHVFALSEKNRSDKVGSAIGSGYNDYHEGAISFGEDLAVIVDGGSAVLAGERQATCQDNYSIEIKPCDHPGHTYKDEGDGGHVQYCDYCLYSGFKAEGHVYPDAQAPVCSTCGHGLDSVTVTFKLNNGEDDIIQELQPGMDGYLLPFSTGITPPVGKIFAGWQMENGELRQPEDRFSVGTDPIVINAVWSDKVDITYYGNRYDEDHLGAIVTEGNPEAQETYVESVVKDKLYRIPELDVRFFSNDGTIKTFKGWRMEGGSDLVQAGYTFTADQDVQFTAIWDIYVVTYDFNDGTDKKAELQVIPGEKAPRPEDPNREEMIFTEWTLDGEPYDFETPVNSDITLTAQWQEIPNPIADESQPADREWDYLHMDDSARTLSVEVTEGSDVTFQWYLILNDEIGGMSIHDATGKSYTVPDNTPIGERYYYCVVTNHTGNTSKSFVSRTARVTIYEIPATITLAPEASTGLTYNGADQVLAAPGTAAGGRMRYSLDGNTWSDVVPAAKNAGSYTVYYKAEGDANHSDSEHGSIPVTIKKAQVTITAEDRIGPDPDEAGQPVDLRYRVKGGLVKADEAGLGIAVNLGEKSDTRPVTYPIAVSCNPNDDCANNYEIETEDGIYTVFEAIIFNVTGYFGEYDGEKHGVAMTSNSAYTGVIFSGKEIIIPNDLDTFEKKKEFFNRAVQPSLAFADVGEYPVYYCVLANDGTIISGKTEITITPKTVTITADDKTKLYAEADPELTYKAEGLIEGDEIDVSLVRAVGEDVGSYDILPGEIHLDNQNYNPVYLPATLTIQKATPSVTPPSAGNLTYNGEAQELVTAGSVDGGEMRYSMDFINWDASIPTAADIGTYYVWYRVDGDDNHLDTEPACVTSVIAPQFGDPDFEMPEDLTAIGESAFEGVTAMTVVDAHSCASIGQDAFKDTGLRQIRLPKGCEISAAAFDEDGLIYVYAPSGGSTETYCARHENLVFIAE